MDNLQAKFRGAGETLQARMAALGTVGHSHQAVPMKHDPVHLDLGMVRIKFVNGRWMEGECFPMLSTPNPIQWHIRWQRTHD